VYHVVNKKEFHGDNMDIKQFSDPNTGRLVPVSNVSGASHAFIPASLPPQWEWPQELWPLLLDARTALASLNGIGRHLPNPQLLLRPLQNREALKSSSLEGTYTIPEKQLVFQLDPQEPTSEADPVNDYKEVFNYSMALQVTTNDADSLPLSLRLICKLHSILMTGVRGSDKEPGKFRRLQVQVGRPARYVPPPPNEVMPCLDNFEKYLHQNTPYDPLVNAFLAHYQFEAIHPFRDGNGRIGRLLLALTIAEWCQLTNQWLYMSAYFDNNKDDYINCLFDVSTKGAWKEWIEFCLIGVVEQSKDTENRCEKLLTLSEEFKQRLASVKGSNRLNMILDDLLVSPVITIPNLAKKFNVRYQTAKADVDKLKKAKIIKRLREMRQKTFYSPEILAITYQDDSEG